MASGRKLRVGVIGAGGAGGGAAARAKESPVMELAAIAEVDDARRTCMAEKFGVPGYKDYRELLKRDDIEMVYSGTPNWIHAEVAVAALDAGKHIFSEKPMGMNRREIALMLAAEKRSGKFLQIDFEMRYSVMLKRIRDIVDAGELGEVKNIHFTHNNGGTGFVKRPGDWRVDIAKVGGYFVEEGCHRLDIFRYWMKEEMTEIEAIPAPELRGPDGWHRAYREPACTLCFFPGEKLAVLTSLQHRGAGIIPTPGTEQRLGHQYDASLMGSDGSIRADFWDKYIQLFRFEEPNGVTVHARTETFEGVPPQRIHHDSRGFLEDFARRILAGEKPFMSAEDSWRSMAAVFAAEESMKSGRRVAIDYALPAV